MKNLLKVIANFSTEQLTSVNKLLNQEKYKEAGLLIERYRVLNELRNK